MRADTISDGILSLLHLAVFIFAVQAIFHILRTFHWTTMTIEGVLAFYSRKRGCLGLSGTDWAVVISALLTAWSATGALAFGAADRTQRTIAGITLVGAIMVLSYCVYWQAGRAPFLATARHHLERLEIMLVEEPKGTREALGLGLYCERFRALIQEVEQTGSRNEIQPQHPPNPRPSSVR